MPQLPFFSGEEQEGDVSFDVWKFELNCLIKESVYPDSLILQAIRKSLRGKSRDILLTLGESASPSIILNKLEGIYGNVSSNEVLLQQFYLESQLENESIADYSVRIENVLRRATQNRPVAEVVRSEILCARLRNGLRDHLLKNSCRFKFETEKNFNKLRKYIRSVEQDLSTSAAAKQMSSESSSSADGKSTKDTKSLAQSLLATDKSGQKIDNMFIQMKQLREKFKDTEKNLLKFHFKPNPLRPVLPPTLPHNITIPLKEAEVDSFKEVEDHKAEAEVFIIIEVVVDKEVVTSITKIVLINKPVTQPPLPIH